MIVQNLGIFGRLGAEQEVHVCSLFHDNSFAPEDCVIRKSVNENTIAPLVGSLCCCEGNEILCLVLHDEILRAFWPHGDQ